MIAYVTVFPTGCVSYYGPHTLSCLNTVWKSSGCLEEGDIYPEKASGYRLFVWANLNIRYCTVAVKIAWIVFVRIKLLSKC